MIKRASLIFVLAAAAHAQQCDRLVLFNVSQQSRRVAVDPATLHVEAKSGSTAFAIANLDQSHLSPKVVVLIDVSESMRTETSTVTRAVGALLVSLPPSAKVALGAFDDSLKMLSNFGDTRDDTANKLIAYLRARHSFSGRTAMLASMQQAASQFGSPEGGNSLVIVTDGVDNRSTIRASKLFETLHDGNIRVFVWLFASDLHTPEEIAGPAALQDLSVATGGIVLSSREHVADKQKSTPKEIFVIAQQIADRISSPYQLKILNAPAAGRLNLKVSASPTPNLGHLEAEYPRYLPNCSRPSTAAQP